MRVLVTCLSLATIVTCACSPGIPADVPDVVTDIGPCEQTAAMFQVGADEQPLAIHDGDVLPLVQGFQGFLFIRVGLRSVQTVPGVVKLAVHVRVPGRVDQTGQFQSVHAKALAEGGWQSGDVPFFFNDASLADLVGRTAQVDVWTTSPGCRLVASREVTLTTGAFMSQDAGFWETDGGGLP
jgi:hypothetical protein